MKKITLICILLVAVRLFAVIDDPWGPKVIYNSGMSLTCRITVNGINATEDDLLMVAVGNEVRGKTNLERITNNSVPPNSVGRNFLIQSAHDGEVFNFYLWRPNPPTGELPRILTTTYTLISIVGGQHGGQGNYQTINFTISTVSVQGKVTLGVGGAGLPNVQMIVQNSTPTYNTSFYSSLVTNSQGEYCLPGISSGTRITFEPYNPAFAFTPQNYDNQSGLYSVVTQNFVATALATFTVTGTVKTIENQPIPGVFIYHDIYLDNDYSTDASGYFTFPLVQGSYVGVHPTKTGWTFSPPHVDINGITSNLTLEPFTGTPTYFTISGNTGIPDATVIYDCNNSSSGSVISDSNGYYVINNIIYADTVRVEPHKTGITFTPTDRTLSNVTSHQANINFNAGITNHTISGFIYLSGSALPGINIYIGNTPVATTSATGYYTFSRQFGEGFIFNPEANGYLFDPISRQVDNLITDLSSQNFDAEIIPTYPVTVSVKEGGTTPLDNVNIAYTVTGGLSGSGTTDTSGEVTFTLNATGSNITFTPSRIEYNFSPPSQILSGLGGAETVPFVATRKTFTITGNTGVGGVTITLSIGGTVTSDANGNFTIPDVPYGTTFTITPSLDGYTFLPTTYTVSNVTSDRNIGNPFTVTIIQYLVTVHCVDHLGANIQNVIVTYNAGTGYTNALGIFTFLADHGSNVVVTVRKNGIVFDQNTGQQSWITAPRTFDFTSRPATEYNLTGLVTLAGGSTPLEGVRIQAGDNFGMTIADGTYTVIIYEAGVFEITPSKTGYQFAPSQEFVNGATGPLTKNFTATINEYDIDGIVLKDGQPLTGVAITLNGTLYMTTNSNGQFSLRATHGSLNTIVPSKAGHVFTPTEYQLPALLVPISNLVFEAEPQPILISGYVVTNHNPGFPVMAVTVYDLNSSRSVSTDDTGLYSMRVFYGENVLLRPEKTLYSFSPADTLLPNVTSLISNQDFIATAICDTVSFSHTSDIYPAPISVTLSNTDTEAEIRFTRDGSTPNATSELFTTGQPIYLPRDSNLTIKAIAIKDYCQSSAITQRHYIVSGLSYKPSIILESGSFTHAIAVTIDMPDYIPNLNLPDGDINDYQIYYTTNGSTPTSNSYLYTEPVFINKNTVLKAAIMRQHYIVEPDSVAVGYYEINHIMSLRFLDTIYLLENGYNLTLDLRNYLTDSVAGEHEYTVSLVEQPQYLGYTTSAPANLQIIQPLDWYGSDNMQVKIQYIPTPLPPSAYPFESEPPDPATLNWAVDTVYIYVHSSSDSDETASVPEEKMLTNYPNPFNPVTTVEFTLPADNDVELAVYNIKGQLIQQLAHQRYTKGAHRVIWDASGQSSGIYFVALKYAGLTKIHKMVLMK